MALNVTYHSTDDDKLPSYGDNTIIPVWPLQLSAEAIAMDGDGAVQTGAVVARLVAEEDCRIEIGVTPSATASSFKMTAGSIEALFIPYGERLNVIAAV